MPRIRAIAAAALLAATPFLLAAPASAAAPRGNAELIPVQGYVYGYDYGRPRYAPPPHYYRPPPPRYYRPPPRVYYAPPPYRYYHGGPPGPYRRF